MGSVEHFEGLLNATSSRLQKTCDEWQGFLDADPAPLKCPEDAVCEIMSAIGKTNLLLKSKLPQFQRLVEDLRHGQYGQRPITPADLQGFWDLISLEISEVDERFAKIAKRRTLNWAQLADEEVLETPKKTDKSKTNGTDKPDSSGKSKNFDHLRTAAKARLALAKAKMQESMKNGAGGGGNGEKEKQLENGKAQDAGNESNGNTNGLQCNVKCTGNDRDIGRLSIC